jgi:dihydropyrimidinase
VPDRPFPVSPAFNASKIVAAVEAFLPRKKPMTYDLIVRGGTVVLPSTTITADVGIVGEKIASIGDLKEALAHRVFEAAGKLVLPGLVDPHVHLADEEADKNAYAVDDFYTGTVAAAFGGNTTLLDFAPATPDHSATTALQHRRRQTEGQAAVDFSHHIIVEQETPISLETISQLPSHGTNTIKIFMFHPRMADDYALLQVIQTAAQNNLLVMVHAENHALLNGFQNATIAQGGTTIAHYPASQPPLLEIEAAQRAILLAEHTGATLYIVHISCAATVQLVREAQKRGCNVIGETVPHYLTLTEEVYASPNGTDYLCGPPIRTAADSDALWQGLADGTLTVVGSDHCGFSAAQKAWGQEDFRRGPKGIAGIETRAAVIYSEGVAKGRISLRQFVDVMSTNPARIFGLYPQKGALLPGSDADLCIFDPRVEWVVTHDALHCGWGYTPHQGLKVTGKPVLTVLRGNVIVDGNRFDGQPGGGRFLARNSFRKG